MKRKLLALLLILCIFTTSCFSYKDINKLLIVVSTIIDVDDKGNVVLYLEIFKPYRSEQTPGGKGQRLIYKSTGESILEAIRDLNLGTSQKLNFTQNRSLIFTKKAAEKGLDYFLDMINRDQEFVLRQYMYILEQDPEKLMRMHLIEEEYIGIYLYELPLNQGAAKRFVTRLDDYLNNRLTGNEVNLIPTLLMTHGQLDSQLRLHKSAVFKKDKLIGEMSFDETAIYNLLTGPLKTGTLIVMGENQNKMTLEIVGSRVKTNLKYDGETVTATYDINIRTTFASTQKQLELNKSNVRKKIIDIAEKNTKEKCHKLFDKWKEKGTDIFRITRQFEREYPGEKLPVKDIIEITEMEANINITIEGSSDVTDYVD